MAIDPTKVGSYPERVFSGGGYFYDDLLEYRVWFKTSSGKNKYNAFSKFSDAEEFCDKTPDAEIPIALVYQKEHINELSPGHFQHIKGPRITEWQVAWLQGNQNTVEQIPKFLAEHRM